MRLRLKFYRALQRWGVGPILRKTGAIARVQESFAGAQVWAHAASAGELETLWPVLEELRLRSPSVRIHVSVFSPSAQELLLQLKERSLGTGMSFSSAPWEGEWAQALDQVRPCVFVTAKYEAWPDLWASLEERSIPFLTLAAQPRRSLKSALKILHLLGARVPALWFSALSDESARSLKQMFHSARVESHGDPRFDRVLARLKKPSPRAQELMSCLRNRRRSPVLGSVWIEDLPYVKALLKERQGILVPHDVDQESLKRFTQALNPSSWVLSSQIREGTTLELEGWILVDERGVLAELYALASHVYVGGGFSKGVHSVVEPAFQGVPIACGPKNIELFPEIESLSSLGQLSCIRSARELELWYQRVQRTEPEEQWRKAAQQSCGASERVLAWILERIQGTLGRA